MAPWYENKSNKEANKIALNHHFGLRVGNVSKFTSLKSVFEIFYASRQSIMSDEKVNDIKYKDCSLATHNECRIIIRFLAQELPKH